MTSTTFVVITTVITKARPADYYQCENSPVYNTV